MESLVTIFPQMIKFNQNKKTTQNFILFCFEHNVCKLHNCLKWHQRLLVLYYWECAMVPLHIYVRVNPGTVFQKGMSGRIKNKSKYCKYANYAYKIRYLRKSCHQFRENGSVLIVWDDCKIQMVLTTNVIGINTLNTPGSKSVRTYFFYSWRL